MFLYSRHRIEREEKAKLRSAGQSWKDKSFPPQELAEQLEDDRRRFQLRVVDVSDLVQLGSLQWCRLNTIA